MSEPTANEPADAVDHGHIAGYRLIESIGRGATAEVWRARRTRDGTTVALKRLRATAGVPATVEARSRLVREATVLRNLAHPGIVAMLGVVDDPATGGVAIVLEHLDGGSLAELLAERGRLEWRELVSMATVIGAALDAAHRSGVVHRDVKPANVVFDGEGHPHLADFGAALRARAGRAAHETGRTGTSVTGTVDYLDPSVLDGRSLDERSDVYALGVVCFEALAGRPPFTGASPMETLRAAADAPPHELVALLARRRSDVPELIAATIVRAMAADPADRFDTAGAFASALQAASALSALPDRISVDAAPDIPDVPDVLDIIDILDTMTMTIPVRQPVGVPSGSGARQRRERDGRRTRRGGVKWVLGMGFGAAAAATLAFLALSPLSAGDTSVSSGSSSVDAPPAAETLDSPATAHTSDAVDAPETVGRAAAPASDVSVVETGPIAPDATATVSIVGPDGITEVTGPDGIGRRIAVGRPGDQVLIADWDCDGTATVGLYRPTSGKFYAFPGWATSDTPAASRPPLTLAPGGTLHASSHADGCVSPSS